ncbi:hypothetical protein DNL40_14875 [Xylanimonas oleitrophica]|uniref:DNA-binding protein n=1 Tax=Xylanimonas oleitrophica TaxID=2607479 RepID=A0A2W5WVA4_9MICO|nr:hypothetical protein [Xylanimonas oleitrophica]PZR51755.1 hypothetical protein DNL40_14875 [Xylanimonas oleitrophica]
MPDAASTDLPTREFLLVLDRPLEPADEERLRSEGLEDAAPLTENGHGMLAVGRQAATLTDAVASAVTQVRAAGLEVVRVLGPETDLVALSTVARRLGRTYESVRLLAAGKRGPGGFPVPVSGDGAALYSWTAVAAWAREHLDAPVQPDDDARVIAAADHLLAARALVARDEREALLAALV